ncbi:unnamed protein product [Clonostachys rhizophaga]|uniref:Uncharacterized protein n=1 Tax=Clonostachys rhizophaga TaxID=160324 RepID=A0A9N9VE15_9HYPO|nr:unnamed protein product [Clonostachys rhizophaga]
MATRSAKLNLKIILLGDAGVGKTSVLNQHVFELFPSTQFVTRIPPDFVVKGAMVNDRRVTLQFWDPAGLERFGPIHKPWYRNTHCCVLMYDINNEKSFQSLENWLKGCHDACFNMDINNFPVILLGNKIDGGDKRQVTPEQALQFCAENGNIPYFETSAKDATNLQEAFGTAARFALGHKDMLEKLAEHDKSLVSVEQSNTKKTCW